MEKQLFSVEDKVTTLVGMNESGKTAILEAMAKSRYFEKDSDFTFNLQNDYPRKELVKFQRKQAPSDQEVVICTYLIDENTIQSIEESLGEGILLYDEFYIRTFYEGLSTVGNIAINLDKFKDFLIDQFNILEDDVSTIRNIKDFSEINTLIDEENSEAIQEAANFIKGIVDSSPENWEHSIEGYIYKKWIEPNTPYFWYYDEYFNLDSRTNLRALKENKLTQQSQKTASALIEVAGLDIDSIIKNDDYEKFITILESTSIEITDTMFEYWSANQNLDINFKIDEQTNKDPILDIRVYNRRHRVTIPLAQRSKGFNWFFSFIVWFKRIQEYGENNYILLLDEPGLNLHASAQKDLLNFIEDLTEDYQVVFTTHSPFMVDSTRLDRTRTVYEGAEGTQISDSSEEKDKNTLFPLQAALGYELSQNLFVGKNNLLVEGPADLIYLNAMSEHLKNMGKEGLKEEITIVPVGGLDKIPAFISLMAGNQLNIVAVLDSFNNAKGEQRLQSMIKNKTIKDKNIRFFDEFVDQKEKCDIEDLFTASEYLKMFNSAFPDQKLKVTDLADSKAQIIPQINQATGQSRFNHYKPAQEIIYMKLTQSTFGEATISRFEKLFTTINNRFEANQ